MPDARRELRLAKLTAAAVEAGGYDKAILPVGATESHGAHLPMGTDTIAALAIATRFAEELGHTVVLPELQYGVSFHHSAFPWAISFEPETLTAAVFDIMSSLIRQGIRKLLVVSAHDGNPAAVESACRSVLSRHGVAVALFSAWQTKARSVLGTDLDHGGRSETSLVLFSDPGTVDLSRAVDLSSEPEAQPVQVFRMYDRISRHGYAGRPSDGSADEGKRILDALAAIAIPALRRLDAEHWK